LEGWDSTIELHPPPADPYERSRDGSRAAYAATHPAGFTFRTVDAGNFSNFAAGRIGRRTSSPPQFGQCPASTPSAQPAQNVHSNEQIRAASLSGGRPAPQHSQFGRSSSMSTSLR
jgi:hypothetical protein